MFKETLFMLQECFYWACNFNKRCDTNLRYAVKTNLAAPCRSCHEILHQPWHELSSCATEKVACCIHKSWSSILFRVISLFVISINGDVTLKRNWWFLPGQKRVGIVTFWIHLLSVLGRWVCSGMFRSYQGNTRKQEEYRNHFLRRVEADCRNR